MNINEKTIIITGAASGIGRGLAIEAAQRGAHLVLTDIDLSGLAETAAQVRAASGSTRLSTHGLDVSSLENWRSVREEIESAHAHIDGIVNNAGITFSGTAEDTEYDRLEAVMAVNFMGVVYGTREILPYLKQRPEAFIANVSSVYGLFPMKKHAAYCASKFAVAGYTGVLAQELKSTSITVSSIHPGHIATNVARNALKSGNVAGEMPPKAHQDYILEAFETGGLPAAQAAKIILDGIAKKRRKIMVGKDAERADWMSRFIPNQYIDQANDAAL